MQRTPQALIEPESPTESAPSILVIEDDVVDFRAARRLLIETFGHDVTVDWVSDWDDARVSLGQNQYDIYLIDHHLGARTGLELIESCEPDSRPDVFIFLTGRDERDSDVAATKAGASDYLVKSEITSAKLERSIRYAQFMADRKNRLIEKAEELKKSKDEFEQRSSRYEKLATDLADTQEELRAALMRAEKSEQRYRDLAEQDLLTGLPNRSLFLTQLESMIAHTQRNGLELALLFLDLDRFKAVNDTLGHPSGDELLKQVATRLQRKMRKTDTVARLGGDEFAIIATNLHYSGDAAIVAQGIIDELAEPFQIDGHAVNTNTSIGIALLDKNCRNSDDLLKNADAALYKAKDAGRGIYYLFDAMLDKQIRSSLVLQKELVAALNQQEFFLEYQPQVAAVSGEITGIEALVRWQHPVRGRVPPLDFIPIAESTGLITSLSEWILSEACEQAAKWAIEFGHEVPVSVNLSAVQFRRGRLVETVAQILRQSGLPPSSLTLEITETIVIHDIDDVENQLRNLSALGVKIAIDDFGTGYSSLAHVRQLPIDQIKIDRSFVSNMLDNHRDAAVVDAVIALGQKLGVSIIAEGVETEEQIAYLRKVPNIKAQGYFIARPMPQTNCKAWLHERLQP